MSHAIDPITLEVLWNRLIAVVNEQAAALMRTSFTTIVRESGDLSADALKSMESRQIELEKQMDLVMREMRNIERKAKKSLEDLNHRIIVPVVEEMLEELKADLIDTKSLYREQINELTLQLEQYQKQRR